MNRIRLITSLAGFILFPVSSILAQGDDLPYDSGSTGADGALIVPTTLLDRHDFAYAYDPGNDEIVLFGGRRYSPATFFPETLIFDGTEWQVRPTATFVSARSGSKMVYDPVAGKILMFGGYRADGVLMNDTWEWDGTNWTLLNPVTKPPVRQYHDMVWDPVGQRVLLFGGWTTGNANLTDMWEWDGTDWSQITPTNTPRNGYNYPYHSQMVFEVKTGTLILYSSYHQETYRFDLGTLTWSTVSTPSKPNVGRGFRMVYDPINSYILLSGGQSNTETWIFDNDEWIQLSPTAAPAFAYEYGLVYDSVDGLFYKFYGHANSTTYQSTYSFDGTTWSYVVGRGYTFDMTTKADGVWNFTEIYVPSNTEVYFKRNVGNTPVVWLAQDNVEINGNLWLSGQDAFNNDQSGAVAQGGPGGFDGGLGGVRFDVSGNYPGTSGQGPGGGIAPTDPNIGGQGGKYDGSYGNRLIQPLIGGSGGSGASAGDSASGGNGGGGGGAILIASSRDVIVNGNIYANGGHARSGANQWNSRYGGGGSGGAIRIVADRITGSGSIQANGGDSYAGGAGFDGGPGRIRLEAFYRPIVPNASPVPSATAPTETDALTNNRQLWISNIAGEAVGNNPTGSLITPDVVFSQTGTVTIDVQSQNIPVGTPVLLRISTSEGVIKLPAEGDPDVLLDGAGSASFSTTVPAGLGTVQATAEFTITN